MRMERGVSRVWCCDVRKGSGRHRHHRTPRPSCGTPSTPSITPVTPSIPLPRVSPPIPRPTPRPTPVVVPPVVNPPVLLPPPSPISVPGTPSAPFPFDPNTPPFTCDYWRNHPTIIWGVLGWWGTLGSAFGTTTFPGTSLPGLPGLPTPSDSLVQALSNTRNDGYGDLYREGVASFLNSVADPSNFPFSTKQVRDSFVAALSSDKAAASQAQFILIEKWRNATSKKKPAMFHPVSNCVVLQLGKPVPIHLARKPNQ
ncbi:Protodermal factor 1-like protein [Drosera capensis]